MELDTPQQSIYDIDSMEMLSSSLPIESSEDKDIHQSDASINHKVTGVAENVQACVQESNSKEVLSEEVMSEEAMSEKAMSEEVMSEKAMSEEVMSENAISEEAMSEEVISEETVSEEVPESALESNKISPHDKEIMDDEHSSTLMEEEEEEKDEDDDEEGEDEDAEEEEEKDEDADEEEEEEDAEEEKEDEEEEYELRFEKQIVDTFETQNKGLFKLALEPKDEEYTVRETPNKQEETDKQDETPDKQEETHQTPTEQSESLVSIPDDSQCNEKKMVEKTFERNRDYITGVSGRRLNDRKKNSLFQLKNSSVKKIEGTVSEESFHEHDYNNVYDSLNVDSPFSGAQDTHNAPMDNKDKIINKLRKEMKMLLARYALESKNLEEAQNDHFQLEQMFKTKYYKDIQKEKEAVAQFSNNNKMLLREVNHYKFCFQEIENKIQHFVKNARFFIDNENDFNSFASEKDMKFMLLNFKQDMLDLLNNVKDSNGTVVNANGLNSVLNNGLNETADYMQVQTSSGEAVSEEACSPTPRFSELVSDLQDGLELDDRGESQLREGELEKGDGAEKGDEAENRDETENRDEAENRDGAESETDKRKNEQNEMHECERKEGQNSLSSKKKNKIQQCNPRSKLKSSSLLSSRIDSRIKRSTDKININVSKGKGKSKIGNSNNTNYNIKKKKALWTTSSAKKQTAVEHINNCTQDRVLNAFTRNKSAMGYMKINKSNNFNQMTNRSITGEKNKKKNTNVNKTKQNNSAFLPIVSFRTHESQFSFPANKNILNLLSKTRKMKYMLQTTLNEVQGSKKNRSRNRNGNRNSNKNENLVRHKNSSGENGNQGDNINHSANAKLKRDIHQGKQWDTKWDTKWDIQRSKQQDIQRGKQQDVQQDKQRDEKRNTQQKSMKMTKYNKYTHDKKHQQKEKTTTSLSIHEDANKSSSYRPHCTHPSMREMWIVSSDGRKRLPATKEEMAMLQKRAQLAEIEEYKARHGGQFSKKKHIPSSTVNIALNSTWNDCVVFSNTILMSH